MGRRPPRRSPQRVVGIGASAGGLEALRVLIAGLPVKTGLSFVILQHLPPSQIGKLAASLRSATSMPVLDAVQRHRVAPDTIVVVPPRTSASLVRGALVLDLAKGAARPRQPIDALFSSLAKALGERAIGVVLSGTASDGTEGLRAIRDAGGVSIVQEPASARFDEMPRSAIAAGLAEVVLAPEQIGGLLAAIGADPKFRVQPPPKAPAFARMLEMLRESSGIDFTSYKRTTIERRLARSVARHGLHSLDELAKHLESHADELRILYEDLLIHVTEFFRDGPILDTACDRVAELVADRPRDTPVRVWVPGCATGEEVYSLAILLLERLGDRLPVQLFGTDLSERAVEVARRGMFPATIAKQVSAERLAKHFVREDHGYRVRRELRERCVFVRHDLVTDPPFSRLDLVSCRNVLIYLGPALQHRVVPIFHYALNQPGVLLLGRAENVAGFDALFAPIDGETRVYLRKPAARATMTFPTALQLGRLPPKREEPTRSRTDVLREVDQLLLARYGPACVVVDEHLDVVQFRGRTGAFLEAAPGSPQVNILRMAREELAGDLRLALQRSQRSNETVRNAGVRVREGRRTRRIDIEVIPIPAGGGTERHFIVLFDEVAPSTPAARAGGKPAKDGDETARLRQELRATTEYIRSVTARHRETNEELGRVNEELQSTNEELQSTNEELQTAKEELQSANEELETVNDELQRGNSELRESNDDLVNVLASVDIAIIIVDTKRRVRRFTPRARDVMKLIPGDVGRWIGDLQPTIPIPALDDTIAGVIDTLQAHDSELRGEDDRSFRLQIRPYRTADHRIEGAVLSFVDISELRRSVTEARRARDFADAIVQTVGTPLVVIDRAFSIRSANAAFAHAFGAAGDRHLFELGEWRADGLAAQLAGLFEGQAPLRDREVEQRDGDGWRTYQLAATRIPIGDRGPLVLIGFTDVTERRRVEQLRETTLRDRDAFLAALSDELRTPLSAIVLWADVLRGGATADAQQRHAVQMIAEAADTEARLIDDLLDLAMSRTGELAVNLVAIDPTSVVSSAVDGLRGDVASRSLVLDAKLDTVPQVVADPRRLHQIVARLVSNAIKFTGEGGRVGVALRANNGTVELEVSDTGSGIHPEFLPHLFESFAQQDKSTTRSHRGLGIGLALVRHLVERQHGTIDVRTAEGSGTTFTVRFPASA